MTVKTFLSASLILVCSVIFSQQKEFTIIGKWQQTARNGNDGAHDYTVQLKNGEVLTFDAGNIVKDTIGNTAHYTFDGKKLEFKLAKTARNYLVYYNPAQTDTMHLVPVTADYQIICDEGCSSTFVRRKNNGNAGMMSGNHTDITVLSTEELQRGSDPKYQFKRALKNRRLLIYVPTPDVSTDDVSFQKNYHVSYAANINFSLLEYYSAYNKLVFKYLDRHYRDKWRLQVRKDAIGLDDFLNRK
ncbi:MAG: hypothetical protein EOO48_06600 [Flavobacterium sp.]|nr:MAG: hypothetical protein EOO48_06600 [Flavobacterium sp.]